MRFTKLIPIFLAVAAFSVPRATADSDSSPTATSAADYYAATAVHVAGFAAITIVDQPGAPMAVWAVAADGEIVPVAQGTIGVSGTATVFAPDLGAGFFVGSALVGVDIRDWLE